jgi:hypothetical protein
MAVIYTQCTYVLAAGTHNKDKLSRLLETHLFSFLLWSRFFLDPRAPCSIHALATPSLQNDFIECIAHLFLIMLDMGGSLERKVMSSPSTVGFFLHLWMMQDTRGRHFGGQGPEVCPITYLVKCLLCDSSGRSTVLSLLHTHRPKLLRHVFLTLRLRSQEVADLPSEADSNYVLQRLDDLSFIASFLLKPDELLYPYVKPSKTSQFVLDFITSIEAALHRHPNAFSSDMVPDMVQFLCAVIFTIEGPVAAKAVRSALNAGILCILVRAICHIPPTTEIHAALVSLLRRFAAYCTYSQVVPSLNRAITHISPASVLQASQSPTFKAAWTAITALVSRITQLEEETPLAAGRTRVCDCVQVSE